LLESVNFAGLVVDEHLVVLVDSARVEQQLLEVADILFDNVGDLLQLSEFVPIMVLEHTFGAD
jgi:hypothetical protein